MIFKKIKDFIKQHRLINKGEKILIGVSGGPDSVALLYILNRLKKEYDLKLHIAHLDHMLRPDSYEDKEFVEKLARKLNIHCTSICIDVQKYSKQASLEETARKVRLEFLFKVADEIKAKKIALGHNFDDQAETVLMRILRGAGLYGLRGILPKREISKFTIIRPLLSVRRKEIISYLKRIKIKPRKDYTNLEDIYLRNRIRNHLLPLLERYYNKNIKTILVNMAESIGHDYDYLFKITERVFFKKATIHNRKKIKFNLEQFLELEPALQRMLMRLSISHLKGDLRRLDFRHIREIESLLYHRPCNSVVDLPQGISITKTKKSMLFYRRL